MKRSQSLPSLPCFVTISPKICISRRTISVESNRWNGFGPLIGLPRAAVHVSGERPGADWHGLMWEPPRRGWKGLFGWLSLEIIWVGVFQYCFIRVSMTIVAVITQAAGKYCEASLSPAFAHVWVC
jgi:hypothetical protein